MALVKKAKQDKEKTICDGEVYTEPVAIKSIDLDNKALTRTCFDYYTKTLNQDWNYKVLNAEKAFKECVAWTQIVLDDERFNPMNREIIAPEKDFELTINEDWAKYDFDYMGGKLTGQFGLRGIIDLVTRDGDFVEVIDWKSGQRKNWTTGEVKTYAKLQTDIQLRMYHYAITKLYPDIKNLMITIYYIKDGGPFSLCFSEKDARETEQVLRKKFELIKATTIPRLNKSWRCSKFCYFGKNSFPNSKNTMCVDIEKSIKTKGMDKTIANHTLEGYRVKCQTPKTESNS